MVILSFDGVFTPVTYLARELLELGRNGNNVANIIRRRYEQLDHNETYEKRSEPPLYGVARCRMTLDCHSNLSC